MGHAFLKVSCVSLILLSAIMACIPPAHALSEADFVTTTDIGIDGTVHEIIINNDIAIAITDSGLYYVKDGIVTASFHPGLDGYSEAIHIRAVQADDRDGDGYPEIAIATSVNGFPNIILLDGSDASLIWEYANEEDVDSRSSEMGITRSWDISAVPDMDSDGMKDFVATSGYRIIHLDSRGREVSSKNPDERFMAENDIWKVMPVEGSKVLAGDQDGNLFMYDISEEAVTWSTRVSDKYTSSVNQMGNVPGLYYRQQGTEAYASVWDIEAAGGNYYVSLEDGKVAIADSQGRSEKTFQIGNKGSEFFSGRDFQTMQFYNNVMEKQGNGVLTIAFNGNNYTLARIEGQRLLWSTQVESSNIATSSDGRVIVFRNDTIEYLDMDTGDSETEINYSAEPPLVLKEYDDGILVGSDSLALVDEEGNEEWKVSDLTQNIEILSEDVTGSGDEDIIITSQPSVQYNYGQAKTVGGGIIVIDGEDMRSYHSSHDSFLSAESGIISRSKTNIMAIEKGDEADRVVILDGDLKPVRKFEASDQTYYGIYDELLKNTTKLYEHANFSQQELDYYKEQLPQKQEELADLQAGEITPEIQQQINELFNEISNIQIDISSLEYKKTRIDSLILNNESYMIHKNIQTAVSVPDQNGDGTRDIAVLVPDSVFFVDAKSGSEIDYITTCYQCARDVLSDNYQNPPQLMDNMGSIQNIYGMGDGLLLTGSSVVRLGSDMKQLWNFSGWPQGVQLVGDVTGDGKEDVFLTMNHYDEAEQQSINSYIIIDGETGENVTVKNGNARLVGSADFDGDGSEELIMEVTEYITAGNSAGRMSRKIMAGDFAIDMDENSYSSWTVVDDAADGLPGIAVSGGNEIKIYDVNKGRVVRTITVNRPLAYFYGGSYGDIVSFSGNLAYQSYDGMTFMDGRGNIIGGFSGQNVKAFSRDGGIYILSGSTLNKVTMRDTDLISSPAEGSVQEGGFDVAVRDSGGVHQLVITGDTPQAQIQAMSQPQQIIATIKGIESETRLNLKGGEYRIDATEIFRSGLTISDSRSVTVRREPTSLPAISLAAFILIAVISFVMGRVLHVHY